MGKQKTMAGQEGDDSGLGGPNCKWEEDSVMKNLSIFSYFPFTHFPFHLFLVLVFH